ncbi:response regulator [Pseudoroseicyclus sp. CXY001]|uniref:response regulator n=1 Tax=Pseudoroseicyclus sp. CXY001 TaxID=3242492 RepID=UPI00358DC8FD
MTDAGSALPAGARILVVEDEVLIGMDLVMTLEDWGFVADGPHGSPTAAMAAIEAFGPEVAILDVNLGRAGTSLPIAEALGARGTPFMFLSGYNSSRFADNERLRAAPTLRKPVSEALLRRTLATLLSPAET